MVGVLEAEVVGVVEAGVVGVVEAEEVGVLIVSFHSEVDRLRASLLLLWFGTTLVPFLWTLSRSST